MCCSSSRAASLTHPTDLREDKRLPHLRNGVCSDPESHFQASPPALMHCTAGDIAFKCNFATLDPATGVVLMRRADRNFEHLGPKMCADLDGGWHQRDCKYLGKHRRVCERNAHEGPMRCCIHSCVSSWCVAHHKRAVGRGPGGGNTIAVCTSFPCRPAPA